MSESGNKLFEVKLVSNSVNIHVRSIFDGFAAFIWPKGCVTPEKSLILYSKAVTLLLRRA